MGRVSKTQSEARRAYDLRRKREAERDPLVKAVLDRFPGAEVESVSESNTERDAEICTPKN